LWSHLTPFLTKKLCDGFHFSSFFKVTFHNIYLNPKANSYSNVFFWLKKLFSGKAWTKDRLHSTLLVYAYPGGIRSHIFCFIWDILGPFGKFHLVHSYWFWNHVPRKIWQPWSCVKTRLIGFLCTSLTYLHMRVDVKTYVSEVNHFEANLQRVWGNSWEKVTLIFSSSEAGS
jgi:hypothetical protein